jgi:hypothetical protein
MICGQRCRWLARPSEECREKVGVIRKQIPAAPPACPRSCKMLLSVSLIDSLCITKTATVADRQVVHHADPWTESWLLVFFGQQLWDEPSVVRVG